MKSCNTPEAGDREAHAIEIFGVKNGKSASGTYMSIVFVSWVITVSWLFHGISNETIELAEGRLLRAEKTLSLLPETVLPASDERESPVCTSASFTSETVKSPSYHQRRAAAPAT